MKNYKFGIGYEISLATNVNPKASAISIVSRYETREEMETEYRKVLENCQNRKRTPPVKVEILNEAKCKLLR